MLPSPETFGLCVCSDFCSTFTSAVPFFVQRFECCFQAVLYSWFQLCYLLSHFPMAISLGPLPTSTVAVTVLVAVSITEVLFIVVICHIYLFSIRTDRNSIRTATYIHSGCNSVSCCVNYRDGITVLVCHIYIFSIRGDCNSFRRCPYMSPWL